MANGVTVTTGNSTTTVSDTNTTVTSATTMASDTNAAAGPTPTTVSDSSFTVAPTGFQGPAGTPEFHTEVRSLDMTGSGMAVSSRLSDRTGRKRRSSGDDLPSMTAG